MSERTGIQKDVWLHICQEGGKWTTREIAELFGLERSAANTMLQNMANRTKQLKRFITPDGAAFGVTGDCIVPAGVSIGEVERASGVAA